MKSDFVYKPGLALRESDARDRALGDRVFLDGIVYITYPFEQDDRDAAQRLKHAQEEFTRYPYYYAAARYFGLTIEAVNYTTLPATICLPFNHGSWLLLACFPPEIQAELETLKEHVRVLLFEQGPTWRAQRILDTAAAKALAAQYRYERLVAQNKDWRGER